MKAVSCNITKNLSQQCSVVCCSDVERGKEGRKKELIMIFASLNGFLICYDSDNKLVWDMTAKLGAKTDLIQILNLSKSQTASEDYVMWASVTVKAWKQLWLLTLFILIQTNNSTHRIIWLSDYLLYSKWQSLILTYKHNILFF